MAQSLKVILPLVERMERASSATLMDPSLEASGGKVEGKKSLFADHMLT